jgi:DNA-binding MarR family transcriptional regulator
VPRSPGRLAWELADRVGHANALFQAALGGVVSSTPLRVGEAIALVVLASEPAGRSQTQLGHALGVTRQHAHAVARRLAGLGLVRRARHGREVRMEPTPRARRLIAALRPAAEARLARAVAKLSPSERRALHHLCGRLVEVLASDVEGGEP